jgi:hypothetical protein
LSALCRIFLISCSHAEIVPKNKWPCSLITRLIYKYISFVSRIDDN